MWVRVPAGDEAQTMRVKNRLDLRRPECILETHLLPWFGDRPLHSLGPADGLNYITSRLAAKAAPWTIRREWNVLMRILNLAVDFDQLDKNRSPGEAWYQQPILRMLWQEGRARGSLTNRAELQGCREWLPCGRKSPGSEHALPVIQRQLLINLDALVG